jgi:translation initiation factor IF-2
MPETKNNTSIERPPIIVIMGHVDHGKTTLLDFIRKSNVVAGEAGGITQHTSAYEVEHKTKESGTKKITFVDTPGHAAFSDMRVRGAILADIAILVVSAEDGVKTQTLEALEAIKSAGIPFIIAINKIDRPNADIEKTKNSLLENQIYVEGYGGDIPCLPISAKTGKGVPELLDMILLVAEVAEFKGNPNVNAEGIVVEANVDSKKGITATLVITNGTLKKGMCVVAEDCFAPVRLLEDFSGKKIESAQFSSPISIVGWNKIPRVGAIFTSCENKKEAEACALSCKKDTTVSPVLQNRSADDGFYIPVVLKADVAGTLEAVKGEIKKVSTEEAPIRVISVGVGAITENDIKMAAGTKNAIVIGFNTEADSGARILAEQSNVIIQTFNIVYKLTEWLEEEVKNRKPKKEVDEVVGKIKVLKTFSRQKDVEVLGGKVIEGSVKTNGHIRIVRRENIIGEGKILELQSQKIKIGEVKEGTEFGAQIESKMEIAAGDILEYFIKVIK